MVPPALYSLARNGWKLARDTRSIALGVIIGLLGAGGQLILFYALTQGPTYLIFPIVSMSPVVTIVLSFLFLRERTGRLGMVGIVLALCALPLFDYQSSAEPKVLGIWFALSVGVLFAWGLQGYFMKLANETMDAESIFFYMMVTGLLSVPAALYLTDFSAPINWSWSGPGLAALIQILNAIGALTLVYAFRNGKALVVSPMVNAGAPLLTTVIAMALAATVPGGFKLAGIALSLAAALLLALQPEEPQKIEAPYV
jgi:drug/metabolite transporter (DMT)-like permease